VHARPARRAASNAVTPAGNQNGTGSESSGACRGIARLLHWFETADRDDETAKQRQTADQDSITSQQKIELVDFVVKRSFVSSAWRHSAGFVRLPPLSRKHQNVVGISKVEDTWNTSHSPVQVGQVDVVEQARAGAAEWDSYFRSVPSRLIVISKTHTLLQEPKKIVILINELRQFVQQDSWFTEAKYSEISA